MNIQKSWKKDAINHAINCYPEESCGLVAKKNNKELFWKCKNIAHDFKLEAFVVDPEDWMKCEDEVDEIVGIVHNHPDGELQFSETDKISCKELDLTFYLVDLNSKRMIKIEPKEVKCLEK